MFSYSTKVNLHDTDAAGVLFFANYYRLAHEAYEAFLEMLRMPIGELIQKADYLLLIARSEAEYKKPVRAGENVTISIAVGKVGRTSYVLKYEMLNESGDLVATVTTVHVAVEKASHRTTPLPDQLATSLRQHLT